MLKLFDEFSEIFRPYLQETERISGELTSFPEVEKWQRYILKSSGKKVRAALLIGSSVKKGRSLKKETLKTAALVEILHTASLIHDDLVDQAPVRRSKPSFYEKFGSSQALLFGDFLFSLVFKESRKEVAALLAETAHSICRGEIMQNNLAFKIPADKDICLEVISLKSAAFFAAAAKAGGILGGFAEDDLSCLYKAGFSFGMIFQLLDDLQDLLSSGSRNGKKSMADLKSGKVTFPLMLLLDKMNARERSFYKRNIFNLSPEEKSKLIKLMKEREIIQELSSVAQQFVKDFDRNISRIQGLRYGRDMQVFMNSLLSRI